MPRRPRPRSTPPRRRSRRTSRGCGRSNARPARTPAALLDRRRPGRRARRSLVARVRLRREQAGRGRGARAPGGGDAAGTHLAGAARGRRGGRGPQRGRCLAVADAVGAAGAGLPCRRDPAGSFDRPGRRGRSSRAASPAPGGETALRPQPADRGGGADESGRAAGAQAGDRSGARRRTAFPRRAAGEERCGRRNRGDRDRATAASEASGLVWVPARADRADRRIRRACLPAGREALAAAGSGGGLRGRIPVLDGARRRLRAGGAAATRRRAYLYIAPAILGMVVLVFYPFTYGVTLSFTDSNLYNTGKAISDVWIGLRNYADILGDFAFIKRGDGGSFVNYLNFYWTLLFTIIWTVCNVTIGVVSGLILALVLNTRALALRPIYRVVLILPWAMPNYITALIWKGMFHQQFGVINQVIQLFGFPAVSWFDRPASSFLTALATNGWLSFPFMMVVSLGALQSIPADLYEAARVDGASRLQQFKAITLPSLRPALVPAVIISVVWTFNMFNIIYLVTGGEPGSSTEILVTQAYKFAFERYRYGYAAAYSTVIFGILLVYGTIQNRVSRATEA